MTPIPVQVAAALATYTALAEEARRAAAEAARAASAAEAAKAALAAAYLAADDSALASALR
jgi:hypothetical protein